MPRFARLLRVATSVLAIGVASCTIKSSTPDEPSTLDAGTIPRNSNGCAGEGTTWASSGMLSCPRSIGSYCAEATSCPPKDWGGVVSSVQMNCVPSLTAECSPHNLVQADWYCGGDTRILFVYDNETTLLMAAVEQSAEAGGQTCLGGPPTLELVSTQCRNWAYCVFPDAGATDALRAD